MLTSLPLSLLVLIFIIAAAVVWFAGVQLSYTTDSIDSRFGFGEALGGLIFLAITTNLPEIAIVVSAALAHNIGIAIGNILGGIAIQTVVLVLLDGFGLGRKQSLTYKSASLQLVLEGILVIFVLNIVIMGAEIPPAQRFMHFAPVEIVIVLSWLLGLWLINKARSHLPWHEKGSAPDTTPVKRNRRQDRKAHWSTRRVLGIFALASLATLIAGAVVEESGSAIATHIGWSGVLFGSTILAAITALPEVSTGLAAVKLGDYAMAFSDIFGGNAFLPTLFLPAALITGSSVLPLAKGSDIYLSALGTLLTVVYLYGLIFRPKRQVVALGIDSVVVVIMYGVGLLGLILVLN